MIQTERLTIHPASDAEMRGLIAHTDDEGLKLAYTEMLTMAVENPQHRQWYAAWFIETPDGNRLGELCFKGLSANGTAEIGYGILPDFQNRGYATEAVKAVTNWALSQPGVNCITAETDADNLASQKVLLNCGFLATGEQGEEGPLFALSKNDLAR